MTWYKLNWNSELHTQLHNDRGCLCMILNFPHCMTCCGVNLLESMESEAHQFSLYPLQRMVGCIHMVSVVVLPLTVVFQLCLCWTENSVWNLKHLKRLLIKGIFSFKFMQVYIGWGTYISSLLNCVRGSGCIRKILMYCVFKSYNCYLDKYGTITWNNCPTSVWFSSVWIGIWVCESGAGTS